MGRLANGHQPPAGRCLAHHHRQPVGGLALEKFSAKFEATPWRRYQTTMGGNNAQRGLEPGRKRIKATDASGAAHRPPGLARPPHQGNLKNNNVCSCLGQGY